MRAKPEESQPNAAASPDDPGDSKTADCAENKSRRADPLRIVRDPTALDLDLDEAEIDRRYGREDIADK